MRDAKDDKPAGREPEGVTQLTNSGGDPIASALKRLYDTAAQEPLPDHLTQLLERLDASEKRR